MYYKYIDKNFHGKSLEIISKAEGIITEYQAEGYDLTLRQLYYQFVARDLIPNKDSEYKKLGSIINDARLAGLIDWDSIVDRTRFIRKNSHWDSPKDIIESCADQFRIDTRSTQDYYLEVWIEKDALIGVVEGVCHRLDVPCFSCRGYVSQSAMWGAATSRFIRKDNDGKITRILHLGDHDPSGIDMSRDIQDRMKLFGSAVKVDRIALTMDQIEELSPPPNPAKLTDSRCLDYIANYGNESWELDSLEPSYLEDLIEEKVSNITDCIEQDKQIRIQKGHRRKLHEIAKKIK